MPAITEIIDTHRNWHEHILRVPNNVLNYILIRTRYPGRREEAIERPTSVLKRKRPTSRISERRILLIFIIIFYLIWFPYMCPQISSSQKALFSVSTIYGPSIHRPPYPFPPTLTSMLSCWPWFSSLSFCSWYPIKNFLVEIMFLLMICSNHRSWIFSVSWIMFLCNTIMLVLIFLTSFFHSASN